jgi:hypothetical protein
MALPTQPLVRRCSRPHLEPGELVHRRGASVAVSGEEQNGPGSQADLSEPYIPVPRVRMPTSASALHPILRAASPCARRKNARPPRYAFAAADAATVAIVSAFAWAVLG